MAEKVGALKPIDEVRGTLNRMEGQFKAALPPHVTPEKFVRVAITAIQNNGSLMDCARQSLYSAVMKCAQDGLLPDGREAALVPFKGQVGYIPMIGGILKKVRNSGELSSIASQVIFKGDRFKYWVDSDGEHLEHEPLLFGDRGERIGVYAIAKTKDGAIYVEPMTVAQVEQVRAASRAKDGPAWTQWWDEMARKTAIRRLSKRLPMSTDVEAVLQREDELYDFAPQPQETKPTGSRLHQAILGKSPAVESESPGPFLTVSATPKSPGPGELSAEERAALEVDGK